MASYVTIDHRFDADAIAVSEVVEGKSRRFSTVALTEDLRVVVHTSAEARALAEAFALAAHRLAEAEVDQDIVDNATAVAEIAKAAPLISDATLAEIDRVAKARQENPDV